MKILPQTQNVILKDQHLKERLEIIVSPESCNVFVSDCSFKFEDSYGIIVKTIGSRFGRFLFGFPQVEITNCTIFV